MTVSDGTSQGDSLAYTPRDPLEGLEAARDNLQAAEKLLEETRAELLEGLQSVGQAVPQTAREAVLNEIYWRWPELTATQIAEAFGYRKSDLRRLIKPYYSEEHPCLVCGAPLRITSRSKMVEIERVYKAKEKGGRSYDWHTPDASDARPSARRFGKLSGKQARTGTSRDRTNYERCRT